MGHHKILRERHMEHRLRHVLLLRGAEDLLALWVGPETWMEPLLESPLPGPTHWMDAVPRHDILGSCNIFLPEHWH